MLFRILKIVAVVVAGAATAFGQGAPAAASTAASGNVAAPAQNSALAAAPASNPAQIRVAGSDLLQTSVQEPLLRYAKQFGMTNVKVEMRGTLPALEQLRNGDIDIVVAAVTQSGQIKALDDSGIQSLLYCFAVDYLLVQKDTPLKELDRSDLSAIFSAGQELDITRWQQLGVSGDWSTQQIYPMATSGEDGVVHELFKNKLLNGAGFKPGVRVLATPAELIKSVGDTRGAIGLCGYDPGLPLRALMVSIQRRPDNVATAPSAPGSSTVAFAPTEENVYNGDYPLRLPFYIFYKRSEKARLRDIIRVLLSDDFAAHLRDQHFMPIPDTFRKITLQELDKSG